MKAPRDKTKHAQAAQVAKLTQSAVLLLLLGAIGAGALYYFVYSKQAEMRAGVEKELAGIERQVGKEQADLEAVRAGAADSLRSLHERVTALDRTVPTEVDGLELAVWLESTVPAGLGQLAIPAPSAAQTVEGIDGMQKYTLPITVTGPRGQLLAWVQTLQSAPDRLITVENATLALDGAGGEATLTMSMAIWQATDALLVPPASQPAAPPVPADPVSPDAPVTDDGTAPGEPSEATEPQPGPDGDAPPEPRVSDDASQPGPDAAPGGGGNAGEPDDVRAPEPSQGPADHDADEPPTP